MKNIIQKNDIEENVVDNLLISYLMEKEREKSIYLISELEIDVYKKKENLIRIIYEFFNPIRIIFSFLLSEMFKINKIVLIK